jgi:cell division protein FtsI/penicillin-binding protein 2
MFFSVSNETLWQLVIAQFFRLQVLEYERWKKWAESQHYFVVKEPFRRGTFYANTSVQPTQGVRKVAFAIDVPLYHLYADPKAIITVPFEGRPGPWEDVLYHLSKRTSYFSCVEALAI